MIDEKLVIFLIFEKKTWKTWKNYLFDNDFFAKKILGKQKLKKFLVLKILPYQKIQNFERF